MVRNFILNSVILGLTVTARANTVDIMNAEKPAVPDFYRGDNWSAEESIGYLLRTTVSTLMRAAETAMRPHGLTSVQWAPLMIISRGGNPTAASLARDLNTDTGAMTRMLDRLEAKGLLMRTSQRHRPPRGGTDAHRAGPGTDRR